MDVSLKKSDFLQVVAATRGLPKSCGPSVLANLASQVGLASLFCFATLAKLTRLAKVARLDKTKLFGGTHAAAATCEKTLFLRLALSVDSHKNGYEAPKNTEKLQNQNTQPKIFRTK